MKLFRALLAGASLLAVSPVSATSQPDTQTCPGAFYSIAMPGDAVQCQRFDDEMPASLVFHSPMSQDQILAWYQANMPQLGVASQFNGRVVLTAQHNAIRVVVSPDNQGSQVDLLVVDSLLASQ